MALPLTTRRSRIGLRPASPAARENRFDRDYWIGHCEGFRVDGCEGRIGFVDRILRDSDGKTTLAVVAGRLGRRLLLIPAGEVALIVPRARHIWLHGPTTIAGTRPI